MTQPKCGKCNTLNLPGFPCSTCDPAAFERHRAAFNGMMALLRESQRLTGEATQQALDSAVRLGKMADAVRALLADVESQHGEKMDFCDAPRCRRLAMYNDGDMAACDEHQGILVAGDIEDMSYAPFVRTLRAMIEGKPGEPCGAVERLKVENEALRAALASDGEAMANLCGLLGLTDAVVSREEGQQMVHAAVKKLKVERDEMRSAARALLAELDKEARSCGKCYRLATVAEGLPRGGFVFACDKHATPPSTEWQDDPCQNYPTDVAAPIRALRALLEGKPGDTKTEIERLKAERDAARAEVERLKAERDKARAEAERLRGIEDAARALLASMRDAHVCHACRAIATRRLWNKPGMSWFGCDEHGATHSEDLSYAKPLRALRALLRLTPLPPGAH